MLRYSCVVWFIVSICVCQMQINSLTYLLIYLDSATSHTALVLIIVKKSAHMMVSTSHVYLLFFLYPSFPLFAPHFEFPPSFFVLLYFSPLQWGSGKMFWYRICPYVSFRPLWSIKVYVWEIQLSWHIKPVLAQFNNSTLETPWLSVCFKCGASAPLASWHVGCTVDAQNYTVVNVHAWCSVWCSEIRCICVFVFNQIKILADVLCI